MVPTLDQGPVRMPEPTAGSRCAAAAGAIAAGRALGLVVGARLSADDLATLRGQDAMKIRLLEHAGAGTMDRVPGRLNIRVDADGRITDVSCG